MPFKKPIKYRHIIIAGFSEQRGEHTGSSLLYRELYAAHASPDTAVEFFEWDEDWSEVAAEIDSAKNGSSAIVKIYAYSWGAGYGAMELARCLQKREINVAAMVLCDPVYRSRYLIMRWLAMLTFGFIRIRIPSNVHHVWWFYQRLNYPRAHQPVRTKYASTSIYMGEKLVAKHARIDNNEAYHKKCYEVARMAKLT